MYKSGEIILHILTKTIKKPYLQPLLIILYFWKVLACFSFLFLSLLLFLLVKCKLHLCFVFFGSSLSFVVLCVCRCSGHQGCEALSLSLHTVWEVRVWVSVLLKKMSSPAKKFISGVASSLSTSLFHLAYLPRVCADRIVALCDDCDEKKCSCTSRHHATHVAKDTKFSNFRLTILKSRKILSAVLSLWISACWSESSPVFVD